MEWSRILGICFQSFCSCGHWNMPRISRCIDGSFFYVHLNSIQTFPMTIQLDLDFDCCQPNIVLGGAIFCNYSHSQNKTKYSNGCCKRITIRWTKCQQLAPKMAYNSKLLVKGGMGLFQFYFEKWKRPAEKKKSERRKLNTTMITIEQQSTNNNNATKSLSVYEMLREWPRTNSSARNKMKIGLLNAVHAESQLIARSLVLYSSLLFSCILRCACAVCSQREILQYEAGGAQ